MSSADGANGERYDVVVVGAGISGLYMLYLLRERGFSVRAYEAGSGVGGTWFWNRYPGARCDVYSPDYSYSFSEELEQEWEWTERFPTQPEIERYLNHVADRFDLRRHIQFNTRVTSARWTDGEWRVVTNTGDDVRATHCVMAVGALSAWHVPDISGIELFGGETFHTARWPATPVDLTGKRIGVIGTGSTGIQVIPTVAPGARHLFVFQRTPSYIVPARNQPLDPAVVADIKARYRSIRDVARYSPGGYTSPLPEGKPSALAVGREEREREFQRRWDHGGPYLLLAYNDLLVDGQANALVSEFVRTKIRDVVEDPETARALMPAYAYGTRRPPVGDGFLEAFNRENVTLVDVRRAPIEEITESGIRTAEAEYTLDVIIFATGFDAFTGPLLSIDIRGGEGRALREEWRDGPQAYLGVTVAGFPNMFLVTGPGSPSVLSNMMTSIEQHVEWIADLLTDARRRGRVWIEADRGYQERWMAHVNELAKDSLHMKTASWWNGSNVPGKPRVFMAYMGGVGNYRRHCEHLAANGYEGLVFTVATTRDIQSPTSATALSADER